MRRLSRRAFQFAAALSAVVLVATCAMWVQSYRRTAALPAELPRGSVVLLNWRGQLVFVHHKASPGPARPPFPLEVLRGTWGTTTVLLGSDGRRLSALIKALVLDPDEPWDPQTRRPNTVLSHPYILVPLGTGCRFGNGGGFNLRIEYLPTAGVPPAYLPLWKRIGSVMQVVAVPHWFVAVLSAALPGRWLWVWGRSRRRMLRQGLGLCARCGYNLTGNVSGTCSECGEPTDYVRKWS